jgi:two-component system, NtrC family, sensor kinase
MTAEVQPVPGTVDAQAPPMVLVVDDERAIRQAITEILTREGMHVVTTATAEEALVAIERLVPSMCLLDVVLPGMDGFALCRHIKSDPRLADVPVALVTGLSQSQDVARGLAAGAVDYIKKPFDRDELRMRVRSQINLHRTLAEKQQLERRLKAISDAVIDAIVVVDQDDRVMHWSLAAERMFGYAGSEVLGRMLHSFLTPPRYRAAHERGFARLRESGAGPAIGQALELTAMHASGREFPVEVSLSATQVDGAWRAVGIVRDITRRKALEQERLDQQEFMKTVMNAIPAPVFAKDVDLRYTGVNLAFETFFGVLAKDVVGRTADAVLDPALARAFTGRDLELLHGSGSQIYPVRLRNHAGEMVDAVVHRATIADAAGAVRGIIGVISDVTALKRAEDELEHARKLEAIGRLAAGVAHEINTPTQYLGDSLSFLKDAVAAYRSTLEGYRASLASVVPADSTTRVQMQVTEEDADIPFIEEQVGGAIERCEDGVSRIATIVRAMKDFAHPDDREKRPADINHALLATMTIARHEYKYTADIVTELGELPPVPCHIGDINQVFLNLIVNATHAIQAADRGRGTITVRTSMEGTSVRIDIADTGCGIPDEVRPRIFEPFFTTKPVGTGTGQGLAISRNLVVDKHGGQLTFETVPGHGTTFTVRIPAGQTLHSPKGW